MTIVVSDSFNRADSATLGTTDTGQNWGVLTGNGFIVANNEAKLPSNASGTTVQVIESNVSNAVISVDKKQPASTNYGGISFRVSDISNLYFLRTYSSALQLYKTSNGTATLISQVNVSGIAAGVYHNIKVSLNNSLIECYFNDELKISTTDTFNQTATKHGFRILATNATGVTFDNFVIETIGDEPTEPEPTPISIQFPTRQTIFKPISVNVNTEQSIYKTISESHSTKQSIYKQTNTSHLTNQQIYKPIAEQFGTKQIVSKLITEQFSTKQSIYKRVSFDFPIGIVITALTNYVASFPTEQIIYKQIVSDNPTNQAVYKSISESTPTEQNIFKQMSYEFKTAQQIFKRVINDTAIKQVIYKHVLDNNPLQIRIIIPGAPELIGVIRLKGKRDLYVRLKGKCDLYVRLKGKCDLTVRLKGGLQMYENQNFKRTQGDTIPIEFDCAENLTGSTFKWGMKKRGEDQLVLLKEGVVTGNIVRVLLEPTDTEKLLGIFEHECETIDQHGNVTTIAKGLATITEGFVK